MKENNAVELDRVCTTLDKLTLDTLTLMEEHVQVKINLENTMNDGIFNLAKSRYILGQNNVSSLQLPTEDGQEFEAATVVHSQENKILGYKMYDLEIMKRSDNDTKLQDPLKWFGVLVPQNLHIAQNKFRQALTWVSEITNIQERLDYNCKKLGQLRQLKTQLHST